MELIIKKALLVILILLILFVVGFAVFLKMQHVPDKGNMENTTQTEQTTSQYTE